MVPVIKIHHLTSEQLRLFAIFDNRISDEAEIDADAVRIELEEIAIAAPELNLTDSGFTVGEIDAMNGLHRTRELDDLEWAGAPKPAPVARLGDVWELGPHRIICGDATVSDTLRFLMEGCSARALVGDPPFNILLPTMFSGDGIARHADFQRALGEMSDAESVTFLQSFLSTCLPHLVDGALVYAFIDWRHIHQLIAAALGVGLGYEQLLVWEESTAPMGGLYRNQHELIGHFKYGTAPSTDTVQLGRYGRNRSNVLHYPGANVPTKGRRKAIPRWMAVRGPVSQLVRDRAPRARTGKPRNSRSS